MRKEALVLDFEEIRKGDVPLVGGKNASLGEMISAGIPVPPGFAITARAYDYYVKSIIGEINATLKDLDVSNLEALHGASREIRRLIESQPIPSDLEIEIRRQYRELGEKLNLKDVEVAVRSSATAEDLPTASFAGQQETFLFVRGEEALLENVKKCFSSLFTPRAIAYRVEKGFEHSRVKLSVGVQKMVNSKTAGVAFTLNPATGDRSVVVIEGAWGVGESVVQGRVDPDRFYVNKETLEVVDKQVSKKMVMTIRGLEGELTREVEVPTELREKPCLTDDQISELAKFCVLIEKHYGRAMDVEWALDSDTGLMFIVQARPETVWSAKAEAVPVVKVERVEEARILVRGLGASPGRKSGVSHVILDVKEIHKFKEGEVLITEMTAPDWVPAMRKAVAIVTDGGGVTAHAAIVSRELGIPCVVGTKTATKTIQTGEMITVDGSLGVVYGGLVEEKVKKPIAPPISIEVMVPVTATKVYMNLGEPEKIDEYKNLPFDGVGLMRIEFIIADWIGEHPLFLIERGEPEKFLEKLADGIAKVASAIYPRPIVVRFSDFKTNEYAALKGGERYEPRESNPMIGWRGVSRYVSREYEPGFRLECRAIRKVRDEMGLKNVWVMLPFVRTTWEVEKALRIMKEEGLEKSRDFKIWLMAEVPSIIFMADEFSKLCDGFSIGSNDLTQLILGTDRDSGILGNLGYYDERDMAVLRAIAHLIEVAHKNGVTVSICGQAPSVYPEFTEFIIRRGIDSVSVNPDAVVSTKGLVASVEQKILLERLGSLRSKEEKTFEARW